LTYISYKVFDIANVRAAMLWIFSAAQSFFRMYPWYMIIPAVLLLTALFNYLLFRRTSVRLDRVLTAVSSVRAGKYRVALPDDNTDTLGELESGIVSMAAQIEEAFRVEKSIKASQDEFTANIAHDLRTPLTSIIGYLAFLTEKELPAAVYTKYALIAYNKAKQLETLIESLFDVSNLVAASLIVAKDRIDFRKLALQKQEDFYPQLSAADMELRVSIPAAFPIRADGELLARVFDNLIDNTIRYAKEGKYIDITAKETDNSVLLLLTTHANPVPEGELNNIFDKLYRLDKSRAAETGGRGLGLFISRRIVELHGGRIRAYRAGNGTAFEITLPR
jgi:signal transduction histidine kinase